MRRLLVRLAIALALAAPFVAFSLEGVEIGQHIASVAPAHPIEEGAQFGECVSELVMTGECPHHH